MLLIASSTDSPIFSPSHGTNKLVSWLLLMMYHTAENFRGRKLLRISRFCGYLPKFSPWNLGRGVLWHGTSEQSAKVFSAKIIFFHQFAKVFSLKSFRLYGINVIYMCTSQTIWSHNIPILSNKFLVKVSVLHFSMGSIGCTLICAWDYRPNGNAHLQFVVDLNGSLPLAFLATVSLLDEITRASTVVTRWLDLLYHTRANGPVGHLDPCSMALLATYHRSRLTSRATMKDWSQRRVCLHVIHKGMFI